ncbi:MAG: tRNA (adenosine(37)-N6)-threonylcarbamoyltransferase complex ATPase subunit type 1 TsaE [Bacteroidetes bacterium 43-16]|nr:MAG: tRNA (adenosine(37)-N6)-threonylcarbamoyltransferase complex ATPase subunit type 1 TsaE [Bacteroidetes bacterium 43-16]
MALIFETDFELTDIAATAKAFLSIAKAYDTWALSGQLGAGKTTFTAALLKELGSKDSVSSPTFSIINQYIAAEQTIYHSDWYRIGDEEEAIASGLEDMLQQAGIKIIEWWEKAPGLLAPGTLYCYLTTLDESRRSLKCFDQPIL